MNLNNVDLKLVQMKCTKCAKMAKYCEGCKAFKCAACETIMNLDGSLGKKKKGKGCNCGKKKKIGG